MIDAVVFDLDGTICDYRRHGSEVLASAFERVGVEPCFDIGDYYGVYEEYAGVADTVEEQRGVCFEALAESAGRDSAVGRAVADAFAEERDHGDVAFLDGAAEAIEALGADYPLALVTNGAPGMQAQKLEALGIGDAFDVVVHGGHDAPAKPAPEAFDPVLDAFGVEPDRAVHVGNSLRADVAGAKAAGLRTAWLECEPDGDLESHAPDYVLASVGDLLDRPWARTG